SSRRSASVFATSVASVGSVRFRVVTWRSISEAVDSRRVRSLAVTGACAQAAVETTSASKRRTVCRTVRMDEAPSSYSDANPRRWAGPALLHRQLGEVFLARECTGEL